MCRSISRLGVNHAQFAGIASHLEPDSVILRDPAGRSLQVLEQNYRNDPISQELLLSFYEGKTIDFLVQRADKQEIIKGKIVRSGYVPSTYYAQNYQQPSFTQPIIEVDGVLRFGLPGQPLFPALSGDSILKPTLSWLLQTNDPGKFDAEISYVAGRHELAVGLQHRGLRQSQRARPICSTWWAGSPCATRAARLSRTRTSN